MLLQSLIVALIVFGCAVYAAWTLMPTTWRRGIALASLRLPLPATAAAFMRRHSAVASGCGCDGCDVGTKAKPAPSGPATITFHPRRQR